MCALLTAATQIVSYFGTTRVEGQTTAPATPTPRHHVVAGDPQAAESTDPAFKETNWTNVHAVDLVGFTNPAAGWSLKPDGLKRQIVKTDIGLKGHTADFAESPRAIFIARQAPRAFVTYIKGGNPPTLRIEIIDLAAGASTGFFDVKSASTMMDVSPDGKSVLLHGDDKHSRLEIWTLDAKGTTASRSLLFFPFTTDERGPDTNRAMFTDSTHIAAVSGSEKLTLFDLPTVSAIWSAKTEAGYPAMLSPGGKYFLVRTRDAAYKYREPTVISAETGKPIGMLDPGPVADDPPLSFHSVAAFTPSGKHIAMVDDHNVRVWDLSTGKPSDLFGIPLGNKVWGRPNMAFTTETNCLFAIDGLVLVDFDRRIPLWQYKLLPGSITAVAADGRCWYTILDVSTKEFFLIGADLPDAKAIATAKTLDPATLLLLHPGAKVSLKIDVAGPQEIQDKIKAEIAAKLKDLKIEVADGQPQEAVYVQQGRPATQGRRVRYTVKQSKILLMRDADILWQTFRWDQPGNKVQLHAGESIDAAIRRVSSPDYDFFARAEIPQNVARQHDPIYYGTSTLQPAD
jgi:hypothetical protein